jgi:hypothetical protein
MLDYSIYIFAEKVRALEQVIEQAQREQKELFIVIFQRFATVLSEYLQTHPAEGIWYRTILGYFKAIGRRVNSFPPPHAAPLIAQFYINTLQYIEEIRPFMGVLDTLLFANTEPSAGVAAVFDQLKLMCNTPPARGTKEETSRDDDKNHASEKGATDEKDS